MRSLRGTTTLWLTLVLWGTTAHAQGFRVNHFEPSARGGEWFALDSLQLQGHLATTIGFVADHSSRPLVLARDGVEQAALVGSQTYVWLGASLLLWERLRLGVMLPMDVYQTGRDLLVDGTSYSVQRGFALGDVRLEGQVGLVGQHGQPFALAFSFAAYLPTGSVPAYSGDGRIRLHPELLAAGEVGQLTYAMRAGFEYRRAEIVFDGTPVGSEVNLGAALGARLGDTHQWLLGAEIFSVLGIQDFFQRRTSAVEVLGTVRWRSRGGVGLGLAAGPGFGRGLGTPRYRALFTLDWTLPFGGPARGWEPPDNDGDGFIDADDACPYRPGVSSPFPDLQGCPPTLDKDRDGVTDADDACPDVAGEYHRNPKLRGCPIDQWKGR